jgi:hypothetical protein
MLDRAILFCNLRTLILAWEALPLEQVCGSKCAVSHVLCRHNICSNTLHIAEFYYKNCEGTLAVSCVDTMICVAGFFNRRVLCAPIMLALALSLFFTTFVYACGVWSVEGRPCNIDFVWTYAANSKVQHYICARGNEASKAYYRFHFFKMPPITLGLSTQKRRCHLQQTESIFCLKKHCL